MWTIALLLNMTKVNFKKKNHIRSNTGRETDIFLNFLLQEQAKSLNSTPKQMRWLPEVIKFCLANYHS